MTFQLEMHAYCGMTIPLASGEIDECRDAAAHAIRRHRRTNREVSVLEPGKTWEFLEAEDGSMVNDDEGVLVLKEIFEDDIEDDEFLEEEE